jgi:hypothetical protein
MRRKRYACNTLCIQMEGIIVACEILLEDLAGGAHWEEQWVRKVCVDRCWAVVTTVMKLGFLAVRRSSKDCL